MATQKSKAESAEDADAERYNQVLMLSLNCGKTRKNGCLCALAMMVFAAMTAAAQAPAAQAAASPPQSHAAAAGFDAVKARGTVVNSLACLDDPAQSYALYLPSQYSPDRRWPIIYAFDPAARGKVPVDLYKDAAEKYGYIVVGSNNAKNGPAAPEMAAAQAVWDDTHRRFAINKDRVYTTGLSGGARVATTFALYCYTCEIAGVIAHGASYPVQAIPPEYDHFLYYVAVGDADFNLPEILTLRKKKEEQGASFKVKIYPGPHQWAPPDVVEDSIEWLELKAMQAGTGKADPAFIHRLLEQTRAEAAQAGQRGDVMAQFYALRSLAVDFKGLEDVSQFAGQLAGLKSSKALKKAAHDERQQIDRQESLTAATSGQLSQLAQATSEEQEALKEQIYSAFYNLQRQLKSKSSDHLVYARAFNQLWVEGMEAGQAEFRKNQLQQAAAYFELMAEVAPDQPWPKLLLAETRVRAGNKKAALKALEDAVKRGMKRAESLTQDPELAPLAQEPEFKKIVERLKGAPTSP